MAVSFRTGISLEGQRAQNAADPTAAADLATKQYVDNLIRGLDWKQSVIAATTANITLSGTQTIDGVAVTAGQRVLVKNQTDTTQNGIWVVQSGAWTRPSDFNDGLSVTSAAAVTVEQGTSNKDQLWNLTTDGTITVGTTSQTWSILGGGTQVTYTAGNGISISGGVITALGPQKYATNVPSGSTTTSITHGFGTTDVQVAVYDISGSSPVLVFVDVTVSSTTAISLTFAIAPASGQYRVVIIG